LENLSVQVHLHENSGDELAEALFEWWNSLNELFAFINTVSDIRYDCDTKDELESEDGEGFPDEVLHCEFELRADINSFLVFIVLFWPIFFGLFINVWISDSSLCKIVLVFHL
jgi:hypothetical protein